MGIAELPRRWVRATRCRCLAAGGRRLTQHEGRGEGLLLSFFFFFFFFFFFRSLYSPFHLFPLSPLPSADSPFP